MKTIGIFFAFLFFFTQPIARAADTPVDLKNAVIYLDHFLTSGKTALVVDVISFKHDSLKYRFNGSDFDYSGHFSILLTTPRKHSNPYFGLGSPDTAKFITLDDFFKDQSNATAILKDATIWEKSDGFIVAVALDKEWIHSGNYSIQN
jgi:hypothetical protein